MKVNSHKLNRAGLPERLRQIPSPPKQLYYRGSDINELLKAPSVAVVGSRKISPYGQQVTRRLTMELSAAGLVIISGLALGVDSVAHRAAVEAGGKTIAVLPGSLEQIYPASHQSLAEQIIETGGALVSEYQPGAELYRSNFIERNRLVSGLADALLITEAARNSGSLYTAGFALEQGKTVMAVPGNITSPTSEGTNNLIKTGAIPITDAEEIFFALGFKSQKSTIPKRIFKGSPDEQKIFELIQRGVSRQEELAEASRLSAATLSSVLTMLELNGYVRVHGGNWTAT